MRTKITLFIFMSLICFVGTAQRLMFFDGISEEHMYYNEANDELVSVSKVTDQFTFSVFEDMSGFFSLDSKGNFRSYTVDDYKFNSEENTLTMFVIDENGQDKVVVVNEDTMLLVISYEVSGRVELDRYELKSIGFDEEEE